MPAAVITASRGFGYVVRPSFYWPACHAQNYKCYIMPDSIFEIEKSLEFPLNVLALKVCFYCFNIFRWRTFFFVFEYAAKVMYGRKADIFWDLSKIQAALTHKPLCFVLPRIRCMSNCSSKSFTIWSAPNIQLRRFFIFFTLGTS